MHAHCRSRLHLIGGIIMRNVLLKSALFLLVMLVTPCSFACDDTPGAMLNAATVEVMSMLKQNGETAASMRAKVADLVETRVLPLFDYPRMTQIALARNWSLASAEQQAMLITEFKTLLVRSYSTALSNYRDRLIEFKQIHMSVGDTEVKVKSELTQPGRDRMTIDYDMEMTPAGWKVYDIKFGGVSLITTYRDAFAHAVRGDGVDGLIRSLSDKNRVADSGFRPANTTFLDQSRIMFAMLQSALQGRR
jgi:phospholipid transport system substrate-binding protein